MHKKTLSGFLQIGVLVKVDWVGYFRGFARATLTLMLPVTIWTW
jgi:hypothetical protein